MNVGILYRKPADLDQGYPLDSLGRGGLKHVLKVKETLEILGYQCQLVDINLDSYEVLRRSSFDLAFNLCDDGFRNDSLLEAHIPAMLDILQIPYTGSNFFTLATCVNKARTKEILSFHSIPTPNFQVFDHSNEKINLGLNFPLIVKPVHEDASIGLRKESVVNNPKELGQRIEVINRDYRQPALAEEFIVGREIYVGILGSGRNLTVLPISEINFDSNLCEKAKICTYEAKWVSESSQYQNTPVECSAKLDKKLELELIAIAKKAYSLLDCQDYGRVDFRIDKDDRPFVLEVNPNPDISEDAGLAKMARTAGMSYEQLIEKILASVSTKNEKYAFTSAQRMDCK